MSYRDETVGANLEEGKSWFEVGGRIFSDTLVTTQTMVEKRDMHFRV